jgi:hypothetical protein
MLWIFVSTGRAKDVVCARIRTRINGVRVPAIVFDYPRHSGGYWWRNDMWVLTKILAWRGPGARLDVQGKDSRRSSQIRARLGFIQTDSICTLLGGQSRDPTFAYKRLGGRSCSGETLFAIIHPGARILESSLPLARSNLCHRCNTTIITTSSIKSDKQDVGLYPTRGRTWVKPVFSCVVWSPSSSPDPTSAPWFESPQAWTLPGLNLVTRTIHKSIFRSGREHAKKKTTIK